VADWTVRAAPVVHLFNIVQMGDGVTGHSLLLCLW
jgi:hypothetical protein